MLLKDVKRRRKVFDLGVFQFLDIVFEVVADIGEQMSIGLSLQDHRIMHQNTMAVDSCFHTAP